jgi:FkbM family methyltransferase
MWDVKISAARMYDGSSGRQPYAEIQDDVENRFHTFVGVSPEDVRKVVICGGHIGAEIASFLANYPLAEVHVFEPVPRNFDRLVDRFGAESRVHCYQLAVSSENGAAEFHEGTLEGIGSLLPLCDSDDDDTWIPPGARIAETFTVETVTLDGFEPLGTGSIDLLWCDVQGAELEILRGAPETLGRCRAVFLEVATTMRTYEGQCLMPDLEEVLAPAGFRLAGIGLCLETGNGTGNALWVRGTPAGAV